MKQIPTLLFFFLILTSGSASAWEGIFEIQNETFFDGDWNVANDTGTPVKTLKSSGGITAWINITGFRNMSILNGVSYVNESPKDCAIVERGATYKLPSDGDLKSFKSVCTVTDCNATNTTTATQTTTLKYEIWHYVDTSSVQVSNGGKGKGGYWTSHSRSLTTSCTVDSPETFNNTIEDLSITITSYNNSVTPYTLIHVPANEKIIKSEVIYKNNTSALHNVVGWVTENNLGTEHVYFINRSLFIQDTNNTITRRATYYVINEAPLNWSKAYLNVYTPYIKINKFRYNITVINTKPSDYVAWKVMLVFVLVIVAFVVCLCSIIRGRRI